MRTLLISLTVLLSMPITPIMGNGRFRDYLPPTQVHANDATRNTHKEGKERGGNREKAQVDVYSTDNRQHQQTVR